MNSMCYHRTTAWSRKFWKLAPLVAAFFGAVLAAVAATDDGAGLHMIKPWESMIINAEKEDFFAVNIIQKEVPIHICTGVLYTANVVLLPASCIVRQGKNGKQVLKPNIRAGTRDIFGEENLKGIEVRSSSEEIIHPSFNGNMEDGFSYDLAILILNESISSHTKIELSTAPCEEMETLGWFRPCNNLPAAPLTKLGRLQNLTQRDSKICQQHFPHSTLLKGMFCAIYPIVSSIPWDHGAPLLCPGTPRTLVGLASYMSSTECVNSPQLYTDVWKFSKWIKREMKTRGLWEEEESWIEWLREVIDNSANFIGIAIGLLVIAVTCYCYQVR